MSAWGRFLHRSVIHRDGGCVNGVCSWVSFFKRAKAGPSQLERLASLLERCPTSTKATARQNVVSISGILLKGITLFNNTAGINAWILFQTISDQYPISYLSTEPLMSCLSLKGFQNFSCSGSKLFPFWMYCLAKFFLPFIYFFANYLSPCKWFLSTIRQKGHEYVHKKSPEDKNRKTSWENDHEIWDKKKMSYKQL